MLPNFICPGAARSATTTLYYLLIQHPQVFLPRIKETKFFAINYDKGLPWYESRYYAKAAGEIAIGDISPAYLCHEECPKRIYQSLGPKVKFIFMLRNPITRAVSHYNFLRNMQLEDLPLPEAFWSPNRQARSLRFFHHEYGFQYLKESCYAQHISRYLEYFNYKNMKFIIFEEFINNIEENLPDLLRFLEVDTRHNFRLDLYKNQNTGTKRATLSQLFYRNHISQKIRDLIQMNTTWKTQVVLKKLKNIILARSDCKTMYTKLNKDILAKLDDYFEHEITELEQLLGRDLSIWRHVDDNLYILTGK
ncbi:MAG: sulfotransferase family protein [Patescibacteria group bacterium]